jgi:hypothetical protein
MRLHRHGFLIAGIVAASAASAEERAEAPPRPEIWVQEGGALIRQDFDAALAPYAQLMARELERALTERLTAESCPDPGTRIDLRVSSEPSGRIAKVELLRPTGVAALDQTIGSLAGLQLSAPRPAEFPAVVRLRVKATAREESTP